MSHEIPFQVPVTEARGTGSGFTGMPALPQAVETGGLRFADGLKSWDVEDPVNLLVHRPAGYAVARFLMTFGLSANQITLLSLLAGLAGAGCMIEGGPWMRGAGLLLFLCSILDSADGIVARLTRTGSRMGQVWDQSSDNIVGLAAVAAAAVHVVSLGSSPWIFVLVALAYASGVAHTGFHAFYMESYLRVTRPGRKPPGAELAEVDAEIAKAEGFVARPALRAHRVLLGAEMAVMRWADPVASAGLPGVRHDASVAQVYRRHNRTLMRGWSFFGLGPHMDLLSLFAFLDQLEVYLWLRLGMNVALVAMIALQRRASRRCFAELLQGLGGSGIARRSQKYS
ncbi:MAG: CDP-alcohol phosphatidyltransferase family protein [Deltaproteobacteria bacterium]|nr:CDP-alcohol phosphatidyltransferase family protein [Deltaproteobacteria bacterium]